MTEKWIESNAAAKTGETEMEKWNIWWNFLLLKFLRQINTYKVDIERIQFSTSLYVSATFSVDFTNNYTISVEETLGRKKKKKKI